MVEKRFQVFISSTYTDLIQERQEITRRLLELRYIPVGMELFPASTTDAWTLIKKVIDESDYYILVVAGRYGSTHPDTGVSYTEMEFDYAVESGKPILSFLHGEPDNLPALAVDRYKSNRKKLEKFKRKVRLRHIKEFHDLRTLGSAVTAGLLEATKQHPGIGWVRADTANRFENSSDVNALYEKIESKNLEIQKLTAELYRCRNAAKTSITAMAIDSASDYIRKVFPTKNPAAFIVRILKPLVNHMREFRTDFLSMDNVALVITKKENIDFRTIENIILLVAEHRAVFIDSYENLWLDRRLIELFNAAKIGAEMEKSARRHTRTPA